MTILVTGSSGHLGEALVRTLRDRGQQVAGVDIVEGPLTTHIGSIADRACVKRCMARLVGAKGYHAKDFDEGPYPVSK